MIAANSARCNACYQQGSPPTELWGVRQLGARDLIRILDVEDGQVTAEVVEALNRTMTQPEAVVIPIDMLWGTKLVGETDAREAWSQFLRGQSGMRRQRWE